MSTIEAPPLRTAAPPGIRVRERLRAVTPDVWALAGLIVVAAAIRIAVIDTQSLWADEALTAHDVSQPFGAMLHTVSQVETTPPLFFVLTWLWAKLFGTGVIALRAIPTLAGIALVPATYLCARELFSRWAGVAAAALVAINPFLVYYSQEARAYMLLALLTGAGLLWFIRALERADRRTLAWWTVLSALALATHFFAGFIVAPEALWLLWRHRTRLVLAAVGVVAVVQLAILPLAITDTNGAHGTGWIAQVPRLHRLSTAAIEFGVSLLSRRTSATLAYAGWGVVIVVVIALVWLARERRVRVGALIAGSVAVFTIVAPIVLGLVGQDYFITRNVIATFVPLAVLVAGVATAPRVRVPGAVLLAALLAVFAYGTIAVQTDTGLERPAWNTVAAALGPAPATRAVIAADGTTADPLKYYMPGVKWVEPQRNYSVIHEIDIIGALKKLPLRVTPAEIAAGITKPIHRERTFPVTRAPVGTHLIERLRVRNWVLARFALDRPERLNVRRLLVLAPRFFRHTPYSLLVFVQHPSRR